MPKNHIDSPIAKKIPKELNIHGHTRIDNYYWLNQREDEEVIDYLNQENSYTEKMLSHTKDFQEDLFNELKGRIKEKDESVPYFKDGYYYYSKYDEGLEYPFFCRKKGSLEAEEEILIDQNKLAKGHEYFNLNSYALSTNNMLLAYSTDTIGRRVYQIQFKNLMTSETLPYVITNVTGNSTWANDNKTLFYTRQDEKTLRSFRIYKHILGSDPSNDELVFEEEDETFGCGVWKSKSKEFIFIGSYASLSSEMRFIKANKTDSEFQILNKREDNHEYSASHFGSKFYIKTNWKAKNFRLMEVDLNSPEKENWKEIIPHREDVFLEDIEIFKDYLVLDERQEGLTHLRVIKWDGSQDYYLNFGEPVYVAHIDTNPNFDSKVLRYGYSSLTTPASTIDFDLETKEKEIKKQQEVQGGFDSANYKSERAYAQASDGTMIPISIVYRKGFKKDGTNPCLIYGYGSYGLTVDPHFSSARLSLLDRGFVYAIAHIRGGQINGREWYESGKFFKKINTFTDFIACSEFLVQEKYAKKDQLFAMGGSAGGLLMGAIINLRPDLYKGIIAAVPFVDIVTTMLDDTIPLTTGEYDEWGNPNEKDYYEYMLSYSPYDQVKAQKYPNILITTGLHDSQVQYWEPAKWVAKLREMKTDNNLLLLNTNMDAGHGGASGRFKQFRETALDYAFIFDLIGIKK